MDDFQGCSAAIHGVWPWRWDWEHNSCIRSVFVDLLAPTFIAFAVWRLTARPQRVKLSSLDLRGSDNRLWIGPLFLAVAVVQALVQGLVLHERAHEYSHTSAAVLTSAALVLEWLVAIAVVARQLLAYLSSERHRYYGLFCSTVLAFTIANLGASMAQAYFAFLVRSQWKSPMWGPGVPKKHVLVQAKLAIDVVATVLLFVVRRLPRPGSPIALPSSIEETEQLIGQTPVNLATSATKRQLSNTAVNMKPSPEVGASIFSNMLFNWTGEYIAYGDPERPQQPQIDDLLETPYKYTVSGSCAQFRQHASTESSLAWNLTKTFKGQFLMQLVLNPLMAVFDFTQPLLMQLFLRFIDDNSKDPSVGTRYGLFLAFAMLATNIVSQLIYQQQLWHARLLYMRIRNILITMLTQKTLRRRTGSANNSKANDPYGANDMSEGRAHNVLSADLKNISLLPATFFGVVKAPVRQAIGAWYMYKLLGISGILGTLLLVGVVAMTRKLVARAKRVEKLLGTSNDQRLASINEVVRGIAPIKMSGWAPQFIKNIEQRRTEQLALIWKKAKTWTFIDLITSGSVPLVMFFAFAAYNLQHSLDAETIFTAIAVFRIIHQAIEDLPNLASLAVTFYVAFRRIEAYLGQEEVQSLASRTGALDRCDDLGFDSATLSWAANDTADHGFTLDKLNVRFPAGKLTLVGGATGSGKTSLLSALIGDMTLLEGRMLVPTLETTSDELFSTASTAVLDNIAYVSQEPWLRNATIRENILFGEPFQQQRYESVLNMCALRPDIAILSAGDLTEIGERGITLSGGQRQRVALARALYSSRQILLIDDCLSAVDAHTGKHIVHNCFAQGVSEVMANRTCVLVTHHLALCLPHASFVVLMQNGQVAFQGTREEALSNPDSSLAGLFEMAEDDDSDGQDKPDVVQVCATSTPTAVTSDPARGKLVKDEVRARGSIKLSVYQMYLDACGGWRFAVMCAVCVVATQFFGTFKDYYLAGKLDGSGNASAPGAHSMPGDEMQWLVVYLGFGLLYAVLSSFAILLSYAGSLKASSLMHHRLLQAIIYATPRFFDTTPIGRISAVFSRDTNVMDGDVMEIMFRSMQSVVVLLVTLAAISFNTTVLFTVIGLAVFAIYIRITWIYTQAQRECKRLESVTYAPIISLISEMIPGSSLLRAFDFERMYTHEMRHRFTIFLGADFALRATQHWLGVRMSLASALVTFSATIFVLNSISTISSGLAGFILLYSVSFTKVSTLLARRYNNLELSLACVERIHQYIQVEQEAPAQCAADGELPADWPSSGELKVDGLVAGYTADAPVLRGLTFSVKHGEKIGVVGRTGAGKSTLSLALLRLIEATSGQVVLDGVDIAQIGLNRLRQSIATIAQDPVLFNGTVRFNLDPFNDYPDELLTDALRRTMLLKTAESDTNSAAAFSSLDDAIMSNGQNLSL
ncbi:hypothetical protein GGF43_001425, partial [Coemansia sp. RSA 2618]